VPTAKRLCLGIALLTAFCGCDRLTVDVVPVSKLEVREARVSLMPGTGAVYLTVVNRGAGSDRLLRVETGAARAAETHESVEEGGVVRMVARPEGFEVPAGGKLELSPGGKHVMLIDPKEPQPAAGTIPVTLHFEHAGAIEVQAAVAAMEGMDHAGHDMDHGGHSMDHDGHEMDHGAQPGEGASPP